MSAVFLLSAKMHERYLFPVLILALLTHLYTGHRQLLIIFTGFSVTHFLNVIHVLIPDSRGIYHIERFDPLLIIVSAVNLLLFAYLTVYGLKVWILPGVRSLGCCSVSAASADAGDGELR